MGITIIACLQKVKLFSSIHFRAMNNTVKFAGNLPCVPQGGSTTYLLQRIFKLCLLHAKLPASAHHRSRGFNTGMRVGWVYFRWEIYDHFKLILSMLVVEECDLV